MQRVIRAFFAAMLAFTAMLPTSCEKTRTVLMEETSLYAETTEKEIRLQWESVDGADRYRLLRRSGESVDFRFICDIMEGNTYTDAYVEQDVCYTYKLKVMGGENELAQAISAPVSLVEPPKITYLRQLDGNVYEAQWDKLDRECVLYGELPTGWQELGRSREGSLRFENRGNCTAVAVASAGEDTILSAAVPFPVSAELLAVTALDEWTNVIELDTAPDNGRFELARSETAEGPYTVIQSGTERVFYDQSENENVACWYRVRYVGDRSESLWSEPAAHGTNARQVMYLPVFMYHEFLSQEDLDSGVAPDEYAISPEDFESDLIWLRDHGYTTITTAELADYLEGRGQLPEKPIILSIDDGKYGVYKRAWPLLLKYGMQATLSVIGDEIDKASEDPGERAGDEAPFCTWDEIGEMAASGAMEIISHTQSLHYYLNDNRHGANCAPGETAEDYLPIAQRDAAVILQRIQEVTGTTAVALSYPYSDRSPEADRAWLASGYKLLLCGNKSSVRTSRWNPMVREAGLSGEAALLRRVARMEDTPIEDYLYDYEELLQGIGAGSGTEGVQP